MTDTASRTGTAAGVLRGIFLMVLSVFYSRRWTR
jgi:hypothetical protein